MNFDCTLSFDDLLQRTGSLLEKLQQSTQEHGFECSEENKKTLLESYEKLDEILNDAASMLISKIYKKHECCLSKIEFDCKTGAAKKLATYLKDVKRSWQTGVFELLDLMMSLSSKHILNTNEESQVAEFIDEKEINKIIDEWDVKEKKEQNEETHEDGHHEFLSTGLSLIEIVCLIAGVAGAIIALYSICALREP